MPLGTSTDAEKENITFILINLKGRNIHIDQPWLLCLLKVCFLSLQNLTLTVKIKLVEIVCPIIRIEKDRTAWSRAMPPSGLLLSSQGCYLSILLQRKVFWSMGNWLLYKGNKAASLAYIDNISALVSCIHLSICRNE